MKTESLTQKQKHFILVGVLLTMFIASMNSTVVSTAMPQIIRSLEGMELYTWPFTIFMLCTAVTIPIVGKLSDTYGFKLLFFIGIGTFLGGSALCGISSEMRQLIIFRGIQGIGAGILSANTLGILGITFSPVERAKYMGLGSSVVVLASIIGPTLGGFITDNFSWRWVFYINIPIGVIAVLLIAFTFPNAKNSHTNKAVDFPGIIVFVLCVVPLLLALTWAGSRFSWGSALIISMLVFSAVMLVLFLIIENKSAHPIIPLSLFKNPVFAVCSVNMLLLNGVIIGLIVFLPLLVQGVLTVDASSSGVIMTPLMLSMALASALCGLIISKTKKYKPSAIWGAVLTIAGGIFLSRLTINSDNYAIALILILSGIGLGFSTPILNIAVQNAFPKEKVGMVTSVLQFFRLLGTTMFSAIFGSILLVSMGKKISNIDFQSMPENITSFLKNPQALTNATKIEALRSNIVGGELDKFNSIILQLKLALSQTINEIFVVCTVISVVILLFAVLLKQLPMREKNTVEK